MASKAGVYPLQTLSGSRPSSIHNPETSAPGLPVAASEIIYQGCLVAYDPANSQAQSADPAMAATAKVVGFAEETVDNRLGAKGALKIKPFCAIGRVANNGNLTAAHLYRQVRVVDDHTVGPLVSYDTNRPAGILVGLDGDYAWIVVSPETAVRGPVAVDITSTNGIAGDAADLAALKAEAENIGDDVRNIYAALVTAGIIAPTD
jgi:hypothetical protein